MKAPDTNALDVDVLESRLTKRNEAAPFPFEILYMRRDMPTIITTVDENTGAALFQTVVYEPEELGSRPPCVLCH